MDHKVASEHVDADWGTFVFVQRRLQLPFPLFKASPGVAFLLTFLAITARHVLGQGRREEEDLLWKRTCEGVQAAGGRVATNLFVRNMDLGVPRVGDNKRLEVVVDSSLLRRGVVGCRHHVRLRFEREWRTPER